MKHLLMLVLATGASALPAAAQEAAHDHTMEVSVRQVNDERHRHYELHAAGFVAATPQQVWQVLTDYGRLHQFIPQIHASRIVSRSGDTSIIEQTGSSGLLFYEQTVQIVVSSAEQPFSRIDVSLVSGDMKRYAVRWDMAPVLLQGVAGTRLNYQGEIEPDFFVPPFIGSALIEADFRTMMQALVDEIMRRAGAAGALQAAPPAPENR